MSRVAPVAVALCALVAAACGAGGTAGGSGGTAGGSGDGPVVIERPAPVDEAWEEIPGFDESIEPCPADAGNDTIAAAGATLVSLERLIDLPDAVALTFADGHAFVGERGGRVHRWDRSLVGPVLDLSDDTLVDNDAGLLGLAVGPGGDDLYVYRIDRGSDSVLSSYRLDQGGRIDPGSATEILRAGQPTSQHNGGSIVFDAAGDLFLSLGDGGGLGDPFRTSQDIESPFGAVLRLQPRPGGTPAAVAPPDNPFAGSAPGHDLIWATGVRNAYRLSVDPLTGDLWVGDVGQQCAEEISRLAGGGAGGENLGWSVYEGRRPFVGELADGETHHEPLFAYGHERGRCAVIAGHVYRGQTIPALEGRFVFADHCSGEIIALDPATGTAEVLLAREGMRVTEIATDDAGELYVVDITSGVWKIQPA